MNEAILTQLKIIVERAVRPVRASTSRKRKMREELLAHVTSVFQEESAKPGDETLALERTRGRFGNPAELTEQLQHSLSLKDRCRWLLEFLFFPSTKSVLRRAIRHANLLMGAMLLMIAFLFLLGCTIVWFLEASGLSEPQPAKPWTGMWEGAFVLIYLWLPVFACSVLAQKVSQAIHGPAERFWPRTLQLAGVAAIATPLAPFGIMLFITRDFSEVLSECRFMLPALVLLPPCTLIFLAKTARSLFYEPPERSWLRIWMIDLSGLALLVALIVGHTVAVGPDVQLRVLNVLGIVFWLLVLVLPFEIMHLRRAKIAEFQTHLQRELGDARSDEEWANLRIS